MKNGLTVAIDGPAAAGKGTIARALAAHFGFGDETYHDMIDAPSSQGAPDANDAA